jgi:hypothetical protein
LETQKSLQGSAQVNIKTQSNQQVAKKQDDGNLRDSFTQAGKIALFYKQLDGFHTALELVLVGLKH